MFLEPVLVAQLVAQQISRLLSRGNESFREAVEESTSGPFSTALESSLQAVIGDLQDGTPMLPNHRRGASNSQSFRAA